jgi:hypothetical protein
MARFRVCFFLCLLLIPGYLSSQVRGSSRKVELTPEIVEAGSPELIRIDAAGVTGVEGEWLGRKIEFFRSQGEHAWVALAGVDVEAPAGPSMLHIVAKAPGGSIDLSRTVEIRAARYRTGRLTVAPKFVQPPPEELERIKAEIELKARVFAASADEPLWSANFRPPVHAQPTDSFGTRRMFNGKVASIHKGMDFRAGMGTPVLAGNSGMVVLARPLYYEGNCVILDHGLGFFTLSMHLSRIDVREGEKVTRGQQLGLSGATGRVTGPHLHWAVRWQGAYLDPAKLLRMELTPVH